MTWNLTSDIIIILSEDFVKGKYFLLVLLKITFARLKIYRRSGQRWENIDFRVLRFQIFKINYKGLRAYLVTNRKLLNDNIVNICYVRK